MKYQISITKKIKYVSTKKEVLEVNDSPIFFKRKHSLYIHSNKWVIQKKAQKKLSLPTSICAQRQTTNNLDTIKRICPTPYNTPSKKVAALLKATTNGGKINSSKCQKKLSDYFENKTKQKNVNIYSKSILTPVKGNRKVFASLAPLNISSVKSNKKQRRVFRKVTNQEKEIASEKYCENENKENSIDQDSLAFATLMANTKSEVAQLNSEEDSMEIVHMSWAELFEFTDSNTGTGKKWISIGSGFIKFLKDLEEGPTTGCVYVRMYRGLGNKFLINHIADNSLIIKPSKGNKKQFVWAVKDFGTNARLGGEKTFAILFRTVEEATAWRMKLTESQVITKNARMCTLSSPKKLKKTETGIDEITGYLKVLNPNLMNTSPKKRKTD